MSRLLPANPDLTPAQRQALERLATMPDDTVITPLASPSGFLLLNPSSGLLLLLVAGGQVRVSSAGFHLPDLALPIDLFEAATRTGESVISSLKQVGLPRGAAYPIPVLAVLPDTCLADAGPAAAASACLCADHLDQLAAIVARSFVSTPLPPGWFAAAIGSIVDVIAKLPSVAAGAPMVEVYGASVLGAAGKVIRAIGGDAPDRGGPDLHKLRRFLAAPQSSVSRKITYNRTRWINMDPDVIAARTKVEAQLGLLYADPSRARQTLESHLGRGQKAARLSGLIALAPPRFGELTPHPVQPNEVKLLGGLEHLAAILETAKAKAELQFPGED